MPQGLLQMAVILVACFNPCLVECCICGYTCNVNCGCTCQTVCLPMLGSGVWSIQLCTLYLAFWGGWNWHADVRLSWDSPSFDGHMGSFIHKLWIRRTARHALKQHTSQKCRSHALKWLLGVSRNVFHLFQSNTATFLPVTAVHFVDQQPLNGFLIRARRKSAVSCWSVENNNANIRQCRNVAQRWELDVSVEGGDSVDCQENADARHKEAQDASPCARVGHQKFGQKMCTGARPGS